MVGWWDGGRVGWDGVVGVSVGWLGWWGGGLMGGWVQPLCQHIYIRNHREPSMHIYDDY